MEETSSVARVADAIREHQSGVYARSDTPLPFLAPALRGAPPEPRTPEDTEYDIALEYDSMQLLSQLEQFTIRLTDSMLQASQVLALEYLVQVVNCLADFTEKLPLARARRFTLVALLTRDRRHYVQLGIDHVRNGRLEMLAFEELHIQHGMLRHPHTFQQLSWDLVRVINICLNICVRAFHAPGLQQQWRTVYSGFLTNLVRALHKLRTSPTPKEV